MGEDDRIKRLAEQLERLTREDERLGFTSAEAAELRRQGACALHAICAEFVESVNRLLAREMLELAPPHYSAEAYRDSGLQLFQIHGRGRVVQIAFRATRELTSTEKFAVPYVLEGEVRSYNQEMLERVDIHIRGLYCCVEAGRISWRYSDWRGNRIGTFDRDVLVTLMERLV